MVFFEINFGEIENFFQILEIFFENLNNLSIAIETGLSKVFLKMLLSSIERSKIEAMKTLDIVLSDCIVVKKAFSWAVYVNLTPKSISTIWGFLGL